MADRVTIYKALQAKLETIPSVKVVTRRVKTWDQIPAKKMPWISIKHESESNFRTGQGVPNKLTLNASLWIFITIPQNLDEDKAPSDLVDNFMTELEAALAPGLTPNDNVQTLGGACAHCWIEGETMLDTGDIDGIAMALVPIRILVP